MINCCIWNLLTARRQIYISDNKWLQVKILVIQKKSFSWFTFNSNEQSIMTGIIHCPNVLMKDLDSSAKLYFLDEFITLNELWQEKVIKMNAHRGWIYPSCKEDVFLCFCFRKYICHEGMMKFLGTRYWHSLVVLNIWKQTESY